MGKIIYNGELLGSTIAGDISIEPTDDISSTNVQDTIIEVDSKIVQTNNNLNTHTKNSTIHITENERTKWDGVDSINTKLGTTDISNIGSTITGAISSLATTIGVGNSISGNSLKEDIANLSNTLSSHTHDDRYYTESEIDAKLDTKANTSHGNHVPTTQTADNATFLRNDNTWAKVTPVNIGAQPAGSYALSDHTHDDRYYTESEIDAKLDTKANTSHTHVSNDIKSLDASKLTGTIDIDRLPQGALDKLIKVANDAERFKLTTEDIQLGDSVKVLSTKKMYIVVDESKLSSEDGYEVYTADSATSVPWSGITDKPNSYTPSDHTHDDRYYTESEIDAKLDTKANTSHGNHVPTTQTADNATFLRNDNTWAKVTPENIGAQPAGSYALSDHKHTKADITDFPTSMPASDVYPWAKAKTKPSYSASEIGAQPAGSYALSDHTHDDRYYTETEINAKLDTKANTSHGNHVPAIQTANNATFLRNDNTWAKITPANIGAQPAGSYAAANHTHDDRYYTETEINAKLDTKANTSHGNHVPTTQIVDNATFLRNDNTWAKVTPANIGAQPAGSYAAASHKHTKIDITDFPTSMPASDVYSWAKAKTKPSYSASEVGAAVNCALSNEDLNNITTPGYYNAGESNTVTNKPNEVDHFGLIVIHSDTGNYYTQKLFNDTTQYTRKCVNGTWGDWNEDKLTDTNTWRGIQDNLISSSTTDSLSANQGKILDIKKADLEDTVISKNYNTSTPVSTTLAEFASHNKSYVGSVLINDNNWYSLISARHRNLRGDGGNYGMVIYSIFNDANSSLHFNKQNEGKWGKDRIILDSDNFKNFITTENVGYYGSDDANSNGWYKVYSDTLTGFMNHNAILLLSTGFSNHNSGLLRLHLRCDNTNEINLVQFNWIYRGGYAVESAVVIIDGNTWSLYVYQSVGQYGRIKVRVLESFATSGDWVMKIGSNFTKTDITFDSSINYTFPNDDYSIVGNANNIKLNATDNNHSYSLVMVGSTVTGDNYDSPRISSNLKYFESKDAGKDSLMGFDSLVGASCTVGDGYASAIGYQCQAQAQFSHAEGKSTTASGYCSHAEGNSTYASDFAHAEGNNTSAYSCSHAEGTNTYASGKNSHAEGSGTYASSYYSHAEGVRTTASGQGSHAEGNSTYASGKYSHAEGTNTTASSANSHAEGNSTYTSTWYSHAEGDSTIASNYASHACGKYNAAMTDGGSYNNTTGTAFVIGNGTSASARSNAFSVQYNGIVKAKSTITASTTADYAEFFEWKDGNPNNEDRVGHFVTIDNDKILIATDPDQYILGIVSGEPFVLGNGDCDVWNGMYLKDEFNRTIYEPAPKMELDKDTNEYKQVLDEDGNIVYEGTRPKINPDYDPSKPYVSRFDRKEWAPVGMLGVLSVIQDGTCEVNGYACCNKDGIATKCKRTDPGAYRVIAKISDKVVRVIFR